jgi:hypothetical protein
MVGVEMRGLDAPVDAELGEALGIDVGAGDEAYPRIGGVPAGVGMRLRAKRVTLEQRADAAGSDDGCAQVYGARVRGARDG